MTKNRSAKPSTRLVAAVAGNHSGDPFEERTFGEFNGLELNQTPATFALVASRYAYVGSPLCLHLWVHDNGETPMWEPYLELTKIVRPRVVICKTCGWRYRSVNRKRLSSTVCAACLALRLTSGG